MTEDSQQMLTSTDINQMLELSDKDFKAAIIKMLQQSMINSLEINDKIDNFGKERKLIIGGKKPNENYRSQKYNNTNKMFTGWAYEYSGDDRG